MRPIVVHDIHCLELWKHFTKSWIRMEVHGMGRNPVPHCQSSHLGRRPTPLIRCVGLWVNYFMLIQNKIKAHLNGPVMSLRLVCREKARSRQPQISIYARYMRNFLDVSCYINLLPSEVKSRHFCRGKRSCQCGVFYAFSFSS